MLLAFVVVGAAWAASRALLAIVSTVTAAWATRFALVIVDVASFAIIASFAAITSVVFIVFVAAIVTVTVSRVFVFAARWILVVPIGREVILIVLVRVECIFLNLLGECESVLGAVGPGYSLDLPIRAVDYGMATPRINLDSKFDVEGEAASRR